MAAHIYTEEGNDRLLVGAAIFLSSGHAEYLALNCAIFRPLELRESFPLPRSRACNLYLAFFVEEGRKESGHAWPSCWSCFATPPRHNCWFAHSVDKWTRFLDARFLIHADPCSLHVTHQFVELLLAAFFSLEVGLGESRRDIVQEH